jgi:catechol 2,3-dioxygenase-like lactoylglutathione lyase family enzyme
MAPPAEPDWPSAELIVAVPDCRGAHAELVSRGATFLADPVEYAWEIRAFFRDPDGHLFEISQRKHEAAAPAG